MEPFDNRIVPDKTVGSIAGMSVYTELVRIIKDSTQEYYNIRFAQGLECA